MNIVINDVSAVVLAAVAAVASVELCALETADVIVGRCKFEVSGRQRARGSYESQVSQGGQMELLLRQANGSYINNFMFH